MKEIRPCPFCPEIFREHGNKIQFTIRDHVRDKHPEKYAELTKAEHEIREKRRELYHTFPNVAIID